MLWDLWLDGLLHTSGLNKIDDLHLNLTVDDEGFGVYDDPSYDRNIEVELRSDGSGYFEDLTGDVFIQTDIKPDGSGTYKDLSGDKHINIALNSDRSWFLDDLSQGRNEELAVRADGSGSYEDFSGERFVQIEIGADGSARYKNRTGDNHLNVSIEPDGSWAIDELSGNENFELNVNADGTATFEDFNNDGGLTEGSLSVERTETLTVLVQPLLDAAAAKLILHPDLVVAGPLPSFSKADRFPPLGTLPHLTPPCATILRLDSEVLFDFDSDELRPAADRIMDEIAEVLMDRSEGIEVHGHTDSKGDDLYNQDLSERRAEAVQAALLSRGVAVPIVSIGFGESQPVAPNETADGADSPVGRQLNRRVEIVLFE